jgi:hypothetical protein
MVSSADIVLHRVPLNVVLSFALEFYPCFGPHRALALVWLFDPVRILAQTEPIKVAIVWIPSGPAPYLVRLNAYNHHRMRWIRRVRTQMDGIDAKLARCGSESQEFYAVDILDSETSTEKAFLSPNCG